MKFLVGSCDLSTSWMLLLSQDYTWHLSNFMQLPKLKKTEYTNTYKTLAVTYSQSSIFSAHNFHDSSAFFRLHRFLAEMTCPTLASHNQPETSPPLQHRQLNVTWRWRRLLIPALLYSFPKKHKPELRNNRREKLNSPFYTHLGRRDFIFFSNPKDRLRYTLWIYLLLPARPKIKD